MRIEVRVRSRAPGEKVEQVGGNVYKVWVKAAPEKGRANEQVIGALARHFGLSRSRVSIVSGHGSPRKFVDIAT